MSLSNPWRAPRCCLVSTKTSSTRLITSNALCTTNGASPLFHRSNETLGVEKAVLNTVHAYTQSQSIQDGSNKKDWREGRAAVANIVPTSTGAAIAVTKAVTDLGRQVRWYCDSGAGDCGFDCRYYVYCKT